MLLALSTFSTFIGLAAFLVAVVTRNRRSIDALKAEAVQLKDAGTRAAIDLMAARGERDTARALRDHWRESASDWRKEALAQLQYNRDLLMKLEQRTLPSESDEPAVDPPSVLEADRHVMEERRVQRTVAAAIRDGRTPRAVTDNDVEPEPQPEYTAYTHDDDDDDGN